MQRQLAATAPTVVLIAWYSQGLSYGVMVAQQFLVLFVQVRVLVRQLN